MSASSVSHQLAPRSNINCTDLRTCMNTRYSQALQTLLHAATPVLRIDGLKEEMWRRRAGKNPSDFRIGPWRAAHWSILDDRVYRADGEVLYFLLDGAGRIRYVGQTTGRLRTRWRTPPLAVAPGACRTSIPSTQLFHNIAWPHIEAAFNDQDVGPFVVLVIDVAKLSSLLRDHGRIQQAVEGVAASREMESLTERVETWVCQDLGPDPLLWNRAKRWGDGRARRAA